MMISVDDVLREAAGSLDYASDALEAPAGSHMREVSRDLKTARDIVHLMLAVLETIVSEKFRGATPEQIRLLAAVAIKQAKGEE